MNIHTQPISKDMMNQSDWTIDLYLIFENVMFLKNTQRLLSAKTKIINRNQFKINLLRRKLKAFENKWEKL